MENPYVKYLKELFDKLVVNSGQVLHFRSHINEYGKRFQDNKSNLNFILGSTIAIRDLSIENESEDYYNLHPVETKYEIYLKDLEKFNDKLIKKNCAYFLAQSYEALEKFLNEVITQYILRNRPLEFVFDSLNADLTFDATKAELKKEKRSNNGNKYLLKILRKISTEYKNLELKNWRNLNLIDWYDIYSEIWHAVTHKSQILEKEIVENFSSRKSELMDYYFPCEETELGYLINIDHIRTSDLITLTAEYGFIVFKTLSKVENLNWEFLKKLYKNSNNR